MATPSLSAPALLTAPPAPMTAPAAPVPSRAEEQAFARQLQRQRDAARHEAAPGHPTRPQPMTRPMPDEAPATARPQAGPHTARSPAPDADAGSAKRALGAEGAPADTAEATDGMAHEPGALADTEEAAATSDLAAWVMRLVNAEAAPAPATAAGQAQDGTPAADAAGPGRDVHGVSAHGPAHATVGTPDLAAAGQADSAARGAPADTPADIAADAPAGDEPAAALRPPAAPQATAPAGDAAPLLPGAPAAATASTEGSAPAPAPALSHLDTPLAHPGFGAALGARLTTLVRDGVQEARLSLNPAEMGPISVKIALDGSAAHIDFHAAAEATRGVIEASLPALAGALRDAGLTLAGGGVFQQSAGGGNGGRNAPPAARGAAARAGDEPLPTSAVAARPASTRRGGIDLYA